MLLLELRNTIKIKLTTQNKNNMEKKTKWTLVECVRYDRIYFMLKKDSEYIKAFVNYEQAVDEFNIAVNFVEKDTVVMEVEV